MYTVLQYVRTPSKSVINGKGEPRKKRKEVEGKGKGKVPG